MPPEQGWPSSRNPVRRSEKTYLAVQVPGTVGSESLKGNDARAQILFEHRIRVLGDKMIA